MKMIFVKPRNTDTWVNGTGPCDPHTGCPPDMHSIILEYSNVSTTPILMLRNSVTLETKPEVTDSFSLSSNGLSGQELSALSLHQADTEAPMHIVT